MISDIILGKDCGHLWYLPTLFLCFIILYLLVKTEQNSKHQKKRTHIIFAAAVFLVSLAAARGYSRLTAFTYLAWTAQYFLWFYLGYFLFEYKAEIRTMNPFIKVILTLAVFGIVLSALFFGILLFLQQLL